MAREGRALGLSGPDGAASGPNAASHRPEGGMNRIGRRPDQAYDHSMAPFFF